METSPIEFWVAIIAMASMFCVVPGVLLNRTLTGKGLSVRAVQFAAVGLAVPAIIVFSVLGVIDGAAVGALIGALLGYLLSHISNYDRNE